MNTTHNLRRIRKVLFPVLVYHKVFFQDLNDFLQNPPCACTIGQNTGDDLSDWEASIIGPVRCPENFDNQKRKILPTMVGYFSQTSSFQKTTHLDLQEFVSRHRSIIQTLVRQEALNTQYFIPSGVLLIISQGVWKTR